MKAIHPDGIDAVQSLGGDLCGGKFQPVCAKSEAPTGQFAIDFLIYGEKGGAKGNVWKACRESGAIASGRSELLDGAAQGFAETVEADDAGKLRACDALRRLFDQKMKDSGGDLGGVTHIIADEAGEGLDECAAEYQAFAGEAVLQVLCHRRCRYEQTDG